tara:strand:+ start:471 stop:596 length:126 start_codon:yes stop_codon:yes gene_type:complete
MVKTVMLQLQIGIDTMVVRVVSTRAVVVVVAIITINRTLHS